MIDKLNGGINLKKDVLEQIFIDHGFNNFKWVEGNDIVVSQWVRFKCSFGCGTYGKKGSCPPNVPSITDCRELFSEYSSIAIFHIEKQLDDPNTRSIFSREVNQKLLKVEREVFLSGCHKAFLLFMDECTLCNSCEGTRIDCKNIKNSRPCPESLGVDVFTTVRKCGFPIEVLRDYSDKMNRYAFLMVE